VPEDSLYVLSQQFEANIDVNSLAEKEGSNRVAIAYVLDEAKKLCERQGCTFAVVMDGVRQLIYDNPDGPFDRDSGALLLNRIVSEKAEALDIPFVDLHDVFADEYRATQENFEYRCDAHWNKRGHAAAAAAIYEQLMGQAEPASLGGDRAQR